VFRLAAVVKRLRFHRRGATYSPNVEFHPAA
jgi:hypothetical protein